MSEKLNLGFDTTAGVYADFTEMTNHIYSDLSDTIQLYVLTKDANSLNRIPEGFSSDYVYTLDSNAEIISKITELNINIYLSIDKELVDNINSSIPIVLIPKNVIGCKAIYVNNGIIDRYRFQKKYVTFLDFWTNEIYNTINGKES